MLYSLFSFEDMTFSFEEYMPIVSFLKVWDYFSLNIC